MSNRFFRDIPDTPIQVKVDLITGEFPEVATVGTGFDLEMEQRRAYEIVNALLREIDNMAGE